MSSKNPRETRENREVTAWDRDSQWTVKPRRVWILKRQGPYRVLPVGQLSSWKTGSLSHLGAPSLCLCHSQVDTAHNMDQWVLRTLGHLRQLLRS